MTDYCQQMEAEQISKRIQKVKTLRFPADLHERVESAAERIGVSFSDVCRMAVIEYLKRETA